MKKINLWSIGVLLCINTIFLLLTLLGRFNSNILVCIATYIVVFIPKIIGKIFKTKTNSLLELLFLVFIFIAELLGSVMHLYEYISWFDSFVHYISGIFTALLGLALLVYFDKYSSKSLVFNIIFMMSITLMVASLWELFEFTSDSIFGYNAQRVIETGVIDTMKDIICALLGCILIIIMYIYEFKENKKMLIKTFLDKIKG